MTHSASRDAASRSFNLLNEPWIPVIAHDGTEQEVSLRTAILDSHTFRDIGGELPTMRFALIRVLLAVVYRTLDAEQIDQPRAAWKELWRDARLPRTAFEQYFERWEHRFDLLSRTHPFLQTPDLRTSKNEWKPISLIVADTVVDRPLFTMRSELDSLTLAEATRWLVHAHAYDYSGIKSGAVGDPRVKGGKGYPMGIGLAGWFGGTVVTGDTLRETLLLNFIPNTSSAHLDDAPIWEHPTLGPAERPQAQQHALGPVALMTWPQRRITLNIEGSRAVGVLVTNGDEAPYTTISGTELMTAWRFSEPQSTKAKQARYMPRTLQSGHSLWRGLHTLIPQGVSTLPSPRIRGKWNVSTLSEPARVVSWVGELVETGAVGNDRVIELSVVSMEYGTQNASFSGVISDRLGMSAALTNVARPELLTTAQVAVQRTTRSAQALVNLAQDIDRASGGTGESEHFGIVVGEDVFASLDTAFRTWLLALAPGVEQESHLSAWTEILRSTMHHRAREIIGAAPAAAWAGRNDSLSGTLVSVASALQRFDSRLFAELGAQPQSIHDDTPQTNTTERLEP